MAYGNLFYNETRFILYGTVSLKRKTKTNKKKNYRLDVHANERKVPETFMKGIIIIIIIIIITYWIMFRLETSECVSQSL